MKAAVESKKPAEFLQKQCIRLSYDNQCIELFYVKDKQIYPRGTHMVNKAETDIQRVT